LFFRELTAETCFEPDGILPLEFLMYWTNLQVYEAEQWSDLEKVKLELASKDHTSPSIRMFMELSDKSNQGRP